VWRILPDIVWSCPFPLVAHNRRLSGIFIAENVQLGLGDEWRACRRKYMIIDYYTVM